MKRLLIAVAVLLVSLSCSGGDADSADTSSSTPPSADTPRGPATVDSTTIVVDDQPIEIAVERIEPEDFPFQMYVATGTQTEVSCTDSECELLLRLPAEAAATDGALVHLFALTGLASSEEDEKAVTGAGGLFESRGWSATAEWTEGMELLAVTVRKRLDFESADGTTAGFVLFADVESRVVRIVATAPRGNERLPALTAISATTLVRSGAS